MTTHDGASEAVDPDEWLTAEQVAELSGGRAKANTVRSWWNTGALAFRKFPELGAKSNKRSRREDAERFLSRKFGITPTAPPPAHPQAGPPSQPDQRRVADLLDTLTSLKAAADAAMQALLAEAEHHAQTAAAQAAISRAQADADAIRAQADAKRVDTLRHLQTMFRGYDSALTTFLQPSTPEAAFLQAE
jgi:hypothetical protein